MSVETNFGKLMELIFITANEIAYPQNAPPNTSNRNPPAQETKYPFWDYRNLTDNQGWLKVNIDMTQYKPKRFYINAEQQVVQKHLKALQKKQSLLKNFKYHEDFDRIDYKNADKPISFQNQIEKTLFGHVIFAAFMSRILMINTYYHHFSYTLWKKTFFKTYFFTLPLALGINLFVQQANPINHEYFRSNTNDMRMYQGLAYDLDGYKDVNDIKYNFKYPERTEFNKTVWDIYDKKADMKYQDTIKYYKRLYGIVDPEPFQNVELRKGKNNKQ